MHPDIPARAKANSMQLIDVITSYTDEMTAIRRDIHQHPEIGFEEKRTAALVAEKLKKLGCG